jgi:membrane-bound hydrogenase subunit beta
MTSEEKIKQELAEKFCNLNDSIVIKRSKSIFVDVPFQQWGEVFDYVVKNMRFSILFVITGLDEGETFGVIYHVSNDGRMALSLKTHLPKDNPVIKTVTSYFPAADIYERELMDLLGIKVEGLGPGHRYPLSDDWPKDEFPLRKEWKGKR